MVEVVLNEAVTDLVKQVQEIHPGEINFKYHDKKVGYLRHDQAQEYVDNGQITVEVFDLTNPNYTIAHELLHFLLQFKQLPRISFNVTSGNQALDERIMVTATELYDSLLHFRVYEQQRQLGLVDESVEELYFKGVLAILKPEPKDQRDSWMVLRTLTLFDCLIFFKGQEESILPKLQELYPESLQAAQKLYQIATAKDLESAFALRRAIVKVFAAFDEQLQAWNLMKMNLNEFVTLTAVLSERQSRLQIAQVFEIYHSVFQDNTVFKDAYIGRYQGYQQNTFVFTVPKGQDKEVFAKVYESKVSDYLQANGFYYLKR